MRNLSRVEGGRAPSPKEQPEHTVPGAEGPAFSKELVLWLGWCVRYRQECSGREQREVCEQRTVKCLMACQEGGGSVVQTVGALRGSRGSTGSSCSRSRRPGGQLESLGPEQWRGMDKRWWVQEEWFKSRAHRKEGAWRFRTKEIEVLKMAF